MMGAEADSALARRAGLKRLPTSTRHVDLWVFALFACLYALDAPNRGPTGDAHDYFVPVTSLVDYGSLAAPGEVFIWDRNLLIGPDGGRYTLFPVGQSLAILPFYALGQALAGLLGVGWVGLAVLNLSSALFAALAVTFVWRTLRSALGFGPLVSLAATAAYGLGTMIVPYAKVLYSEALQSALVAMLLYFLLAPPHARTLPILAALFGMLVLVKPIHLALLPVLLYAAHTRGLLRAPDPKSVIGALLAALPFAICFFTWNALRTGNPFDAYGDAPANLEQNQISLTNLPESLRVLFVGVTKNLFLFNPVLLLAAFGIFVAPPSVPRAILLGYFAAQLLVFGVFHNATTQGEIAWGPRYAMVFIPALMPIVAALFAWLASRSPPFRMASVAAASLVCVGSAYVQLLGSTYDFFDAKMGLCGAYASAQAQVPGLPDCDGEELRTSIVRVHHYLFWHVDREALEAGTVPELPWVDAHFEPTLAERLLAVPEVRSRVLGRNLLLFGLPARGATALVVLRAVLITLTLLFASLLARSLVAQRVAA